MKILVTGGAGFIGANFVRLALSSGHEVSVLDDLSVGDRRYLDGLPLRFVQGNILDEALVREEVARHDAVVHLAAQTGVPKSLVNPRGDCQLNIIGTLNMLEACRAAQNGAQRTAICVCLVQCAAGPPNAPGDRGQGSFARLAIRSK